MVPDAGKKLPRWRTGLPIFDPIAKALNTLAEYAEQASGGNIIGGKGIIVRRSPQGTVIEAITKPQDEARVYAPLEVKLTPNYGYSGTPPAQPWYVQRGTVNAIVPTNIDNAFSGFGTVYLAISIGGGSGPMVVNSATINVGASVPSTNWGSSSGLPSTIYVPIAIVENNSGTNLITNLGLGNLMVASHIASMSDSGGVLTYAREITVMRHG